jgi:hypothetical protein
MKSPLSAVLFCGLLTLRGIALAGPGAHGPGGEHLDVQAPVLSSGASVPRVEAKSEMFELVARIEGNAVSILIDRYETNEPVLDAAVEVESGAAKQKAVFRRAEGDYFIADPAFVKQLSSAGSHPLVFTVSAGKDADLLEATLQIADAAPAGGLQAIMRPGAMSALIGGGVLLVGATGFVLWRRRATPTLRHEGVSR